MESDRILEDSKTELVRISRSLAMDSVVINMNKLDENTKRDMVQAISNTIAERKRAIDAVILGAH